MSAVRVHCQDTAGDIPVLEVRPEIKTIVSQTSLTNMTESINRFSLDLSRCMGESKSNLLFSGFGIYGALSLVFGGAAASTEKQMSDVLHSRLTQEQFHAALAELARQIARAGSDLDASHEEEIDFHISNAIWAQDGFSYLARYEELLKKNYNVELARVNFAASPESARNIINDWAKDKTNNKVAVLLPSHSIGVTTRLILANVIYFRAAWLFPFDKKATADKPFRLLDSEQTITVSTMKQQGRFAYAADGDFQAVDLPYSGRQYSMIILLPQIDTFKSFTTSMTSERLNSIFDSMKIRKVNLTMPKFRITSSISLKGPLVSLGMDRVFSDQADFSGIDGRKDLKIDNVVHSAFIIADENGSEATAATGVILSPTATAEAPVTLTIDHPFIFFIRDNKTGVLLFVGKVTNPVS